MSNEKTSTPSAVPLHAAKELLIDVDRLSVRAGDEDIINDVSFCVHAGEFIGIIGPNGAGKTTLIRSLLGIGLVHSGSIKITVKAGYVPQRGGQRSSQLPISVREVVGLGGTHSIDRALQKVGLELLADQRFDELSGGQQQRVLIAKALASDARLLILDEPTTGIDSSSQEKFYDLLRTLQAEGVTIMMVSHDIDTTLALVSRLICLNRTVIYDGLPEHFEADKYAAAAYGRQHRLLHHHHEGDNHA